MEYDCLSLNEETTKKNKDQAEAYALYLTFQKFNRRQDR